jgi:hypothetical protein
VVANLRVADLTPANSALFDRVPSGNPHHLSGDGALVWGSVADRANGESDRRPKVGKSDVSEAPVTGSMGRETHLTRTRIELADGLEGIGAGMAPILRSRTKKELSVPDATPNRMAVSINAPHSSVSNRT